MASALFLLSFYNKKNSQTPVAPASRPPSPDAHSQLHCPSQQRWPLLRQRSYNQKPGFPWPLGSLVPLPAILVKACHTRCSLGRLCCSGAKRSIPTHQALHKPQWTWRQMLNPPPIHLALPDLFCLGHSCRVSSRKQMQGIITSCQRVILIMS